MMKSRAAAAPFTLWMLLFTVIPLGVVVWFAFTDANGQFTLNNLTALSEYAPTFIYSIWLGIISTLLCLLLAYPLAFSMSRKSERVQQTMVMIVMIPMWMNFLLRTYAWMTILENNGLINQFLGLFGIEKLQMINTNGAIVLGMVYNFLPFMVLPLYSVMAKIDGRLIEAAQDLGSNGWAIFRRVVLPLSIPGIVTGITMVFVPAVSTFILSKMLGGGTKNMIGDVLDTMFAGTAKDYNVGSALALVLMILILLSMAFMRLADKDENMGGITV